MNVLVSSFKTVQCTFFFSKHLILSTITSNNFSSSGSLYVYFCLNDRSECFNQWRLLSRLTQTLLFSWTGIDSQKAQTEKGVKRNMFGKPWQRTFLGRGPSVAARELPSRVTVVFFGPHPYLTTDRGVDRIPAGCLWFRVLASCLRVSACTRQW